MKELLLLLIVSPALIFYAVLSRRETGNNFNSLKKALLVSAAPFLTILFFIFIDSHNSDFPDLVILFTVLISPFVFTYGLVFGLERSISSFKNKDLFIFKISLAVFLLNACYLGLAIYYLFNLSM